VTVHSARRPSLVCDVVDTTLRLAVIPGDGIGAEVVAEGLKVLDAALAVDGTKVDATTYDLGAARWHRTGEALPGPRSGRAPRARRDPARRSR